MLNVLSQNNAQNTVIHAGLWALCFVITLGAQSRCWALLPSALDTKCSSKGHWTCSCSSSFSHQAQGGWEGAGETLGARSSLAVVSLLSCAQRIKPNCKLHQPQGVKLLARVDHSVCTKMRESCEWMCSGSAYRLRVLPRQWKYLFFLNVSLVK